MVLIDCPDLNICEATFRRNGFGGQEAGRVLSVADLAEMKVGAGHRHVLRTALQRFVGEQWTFGNAL